jgi:hypothetical protein
VKDGANTLVFTGCEDRRWKPEFHLRGEEPRKPQTQRVKRRQLNTVRIFTPVAREPGSPLILFPFGREGVGERKCSLGKKVSERETFTPLEIEKERDRTSEPSGDAEVTDRDKGSLERKEPQRSTQPPNRGQPGEESRAGSTAPRRPTRSKSAGEDSPLGEPDAKRVRVTDPSTEQLGRTQARAQEGSGGQWLPPLRVRGCRWWSRGETDVIRDIRLMELVLSPIDNPENPERPYVVARVIRQLAGGRLDVHVYGRTERPGKDGAPGLEGPRRRGGLHP